MMASKTSPPSFTCQHTCLFKPQHRPQSTDHPSRRAKPAQQKGAERVPRLLGSVSYRLLLGICGSQITGLSTRGPLRTPSGAAPVLCQDPSAPQFCSTAGRANPPWSLGRISSPTRLGEGPRLLERWVLGVVAGGAASADDVVVAPFLLIPSSFQVEEPHSQCQAHRCIRQAETLQTSVHIIVYSLLIRS